MVTFVVDSQHLVLFDETITSCEIFASFVLLRSLFHSTLDLHRDSVKVFGLVTSKNNTLD